MSLHTEAVRTLTDWNTSANAQRVLRKQFLAHLAAHPDATSRDCHPDHLTASVLVVSHDRTQVLLNLHKRYQKWMQFGGHCEPADTTMAAAGLREAREESGIPGLRLLGSTPVQLSRHEVQCGPVRPSHHLDVRWIAVAPAGAQPVVSDESEQVQWFPRGGLPADLEHDVRDLVDLSRWA